MGHWRTLVRLMERWARRQKGLRRRAGHEQRSWQACSERERALDMREAQAQDAQGVVDGVDCVYVGLGVRADMMSLNQTL